MTSEDIFISLAHVRPEYLEHSEGGRFRQRKHPMRIVLIAAVIAVLAGTVFAASLIFNRLSGAVSSQENLPGIVVDYHGTSNIYEGLAEVKLSLQLEQQRPTDIEEFFVPLWFANNWTTVEQERPISQRGLTEQTMTRLHWQSPEGSYAIFTQQVIDQSVPSDCVDFPFDTVSTGYNTSCPVEETVLGSYQVYGLTVEPSSVEVDGLAHTHKGFRKYYWSDGLYLFTLETGFEVSPDDLSAVMDSITSVDSPEDFTLIRYVGAEEVSEYPLQEELWFPGYVPEEWDLTQHYISPDGCYTFAWSCRQDGVYSQLELMQVPTASQQSLIRDWETAAEDVSKLQRRVGSWEVTFYCGQYKRQAFWVMDGFDYVLTSQGRTVLSLTELERVIDSLEIVEDIDSIV